MVFAKRTHIHRTFLHFSYYHFLKAFAMMSERTRSYWPQPVEENSSKSIMCTVRVHATPRHRMCPQTANTEIYTSRDGMNDAKWKQLKQ